MIQKIKKLSNDPLFHKNQAVYRCGYLKHLVEILSLTLSLKQDTWRKGLLPKSQLAKNIILGILVILCIG
jgi:hypothetical protein